MHGRRTSASRSPSPRVRSPPASNSTARESSTSTRGEGSIDVGEGPRDQYRSSAPPAAERSVTSWRSASRSNGQFPSSSSNRSAPTPPRPARAQPGTPRGRGPPRNECRGRHSTAPPRALARAGAALPPAAATRARSQGRLGRAANGRGRHAPPHRDQARRCRRGRALTHPALGSVDLGGDEQACRGLRARPRDSARERLRQPISPRPGDPVVAGGRATATRDALCWPWTTASGATCRDVRAR